jgi:hypothetical protein
MRYPLLGLLSILPIAACSSVNAPNPQELRVDHLVDHVQCELYEVLRSHPELQRWAAGFTLQLKLQNTGTLTPSSIFTSILSRGAATLNLAGSLSQSTIRDATVTYSLALANARCPQATEPRILGQFGSSLGIREWVRQAVTGVQEGDATRAPKSLTTL